MNCPICGSDIRPGEPCALCGYDQSCAYEQYPTMFLMGQSESIDARRSLWKQKANNREPLASYYHCPVCCTGSFLYLPNRKMLVCNLCRSAIPLDNAGGNSAQNELLKNPEKGIGQKELTEVEKTTEPSPKMTGVSVSEQQIEEKAPHHTLREIQEYCHKARLHMLVSGYCYDYGKATQARSHFTKFRIEDAQKMLHEPLVLAVDYFGEYGIWITSVSLYCVSRKGNIISRVLSDGICFSVDSEEADSSCLVRISSGALLLQSIDCVSAEAAEKLAAELNYIVRCLNSLRMEDV